MSFCMPFAKWGAVALHGAGMSADLALQYFSSLNLKVLFFVDIDRSKIGLNISGIEVVGIDDERLHDVKFVVITKMYPIVWTR